INLSKSTAAMPIFHEFVDQSSIVPDTEVALLELIAITPQLLYSSTDLMEQNVEEGYGEDGEYSEDSEDVEAGENDEADEDGEKFGKNEEGSQEDRRKQDVQEQEEIVQGYEEMRMKLDDLLRVDRHLRANNVVKEPIFDKLQ
ncbi:hypothetical protein TSAR_014075, partial [Trichomalopsis sarcophagae]